MLNFNDYIDIAKKNQGLKSTRQLCEVLKISSSAITDFSKGRGFCSQDTMLKIAALAGISAEKALVDFNLWKTQGKKSHDIWLSIAKKIGCIAFLFAINPSPAAANVDNISLGNYSMHTIYYATKRRLLSVIKGLKDFLENYYASNVARNAARMSKFIFSDSTH